MENQNKKEVTLKLLVHRKTNKVLFAEVGKEFVDLLFHIMSLPVGTIIDLLKVDSMVGCLGALYKSIESLSADYLLPNLNKDSLLKPSAPVTVPLLSLSYAPTSIEKTFYRCEVTSSSSYYSYSDSSSNCVYYTDCEGKACPNCNRQMRTVLKYVGPTGSQRPSLSTEIGIGGFVKGVVTYMVMDNLEVKPMSTISGITLINKFHINDVSTLEEEVVQVGLNEGIAILKASLETNTVLTTVFLAKNI